MAVDFCLCHLSQGPPVPGTVPVFPQETTPSHIQTPSWGGADPSSPGRGLAKQSIASPTVMGSGVSLRPNQSPWGATWELGGTVQGEPVSFLLDFILGM